MFCFPSVPIICSIFFFVFILFLLVVGLLVCFFSCLGFFSSESIKCDWKCERPAFCPVPRCELICKKPICDGRLTPMCCPCTDVCQTELWKSARKDSEAIRWPADSLLCIVFLFCAAWCCSCSDGFSFSSSFSSSKIIAFCSPSFHPSIFVCSSSYRSFQAIVFFYRFSWQIVSFICFSYSFWLQQTIAAETISFANDRFFPIQRAFWFWSSVLPLSSDPLQIASQSASTQCLSFSLFF